MDRMVVVVFDNQSKAYEGKEALTHLDAEGSVVLYGYAVVAKDAAGNVTVKQSEDLGPLGTARRKFARGPHRRHRRAGRSRHRCCSGNGGGRHDGSALPQSW